MPRAVATKTAAQLDLQALHRVRERLVSQRTGIINQIRAFMLERGIAVRQGIGFLRTELPTILATRTDALSPRMLRVIEELAGDWRRLDQRIEGLTGEIEALARQRCRRPTGLILAPCSARSRRSLATPEPAASQARRPALTAPSRDAIDVLRAGTKERPLARTKELRDLRSKR